MVCNHKFIEDLQLQYVDWEVKTLFIGTFNPGWPECIGNNAEWFYGRTQRNEFWSILPCIHGQTSKLNGNRNAWIAFCQQHSIGITDIIESIDANPNNAAHRSSICNFRDNELVNFNIKLNDIPEILKKHKSIKQICITRRSLNGFWKVCFKDTFEFIAQNRDRDVKIIRLRSPSRGARKGVKGSFSDFIAAKWIEQGYMIYP